MSDFSVRRSLIGAGAGLCLAGLVALPQLAAAQSTPAPITAPAAFALLDHLSDQPKDKGGGSGEHHGGGSGEDHGGGSGTGHSGDGRGSSGSDSTASGDGKGSRTGKPGKETPRATTVAPTPHRSAAPAAPHPHSAPKPVTVTTSAADPAPFSPAPDVSRLTAQPVESLGALTGISFGGGVVLWPLLAALDAVGLALIVRSHLRRRRATAED